MHMLWACLGSAAGKAKQLSCKSNVLKALIQRLEEGSKRAREYYDKWNSIYWNTARVAAKKRVKAAVREMAWDVANAVQDCISLFNQLCDEQDGRSPRTYHVWEIRTSLILSNEGLWKDYSDEIKTRQLKLFDIARFEVSIPKQEPVSGSVREEPKRSYVRQLELPLFGNKVVNIRNKFDAIASAA